MIKDLELMKDISPLFKKKLIIWGIGENGRSIIKEIVSAGAGKEGLVLCDSNRALWGEVVFGNKIISPEKLQEMVQSHDVENFAVLVSVVLTNLQDEIIERIHGIFGDAIEIYTEYAIKWGLHYGIKNPLIDILYRETKLKEHEETRRGLYEERLSRVREEAFRYFAFSPLYQNEIILIYQPGKVASTSLYRTIQKYGRHVLHCHDLDKIGSNDDDLYRLLNLQSGKIISLVREPIARRISEMWQGIPYADRYAFDADFYDIENNYFYQGIQGALSEFEWFDLQIKRLFKIDVYSYPFDKEKGYTFIKEGKIELLLIKVEKLNELEDVIGRFLNIQNFRLYNDNVGNQKSYRFALQSYKENFMVSQELLETIYEHEYVKHFYSEQERNGYYRKWLDNK